MQINIVIDIDDDQIQNFIAENHCYESEVLGEINNTAYCGIDCILAMLARRFDGLEADGFVLKKTEPEIKLPKITLPTTYDLNDLHGSVNDIYEQYDEGRISKAQADEILVRCCYAFLNNSKNYPEKAEV